MAKTIQFAYKNTDYILEFNRRTASETEKLGLALSEISDKPATMVPILFSGAFRLHHKGIRQQLVDEIFAWMNHKDELVPALAEMYAESVNSLLGNDGEDEGDAGNANWTLG